MKDSFIANQVRGRDSSGIFQVGSDGSIRTNKLLQCGSEFIDVPEVRSILYASARNPLTVGHVRHATSGGKSIANAHPFTVKRADGSILVGVHNGTLVPSWRSRDNAEKFTVDSEWALNLIASEGLDAFEQIDGSFAFVWYDSNEPDSVFMCRNKERPLYYLKPKGKQALIGCSELGMLGWLSGRNNLTPAGQETFYLEPDKLYKFSLKEVGKMEAFPLPSYIPLRSINAWGVSRFPYSAYNPLAGSDDGWTNPNYSSGYDRQEETLKAVKEALRRARYAKVAAPSSEEGEEEESLVIDSDQLEQALAKAIQQSGESEPWDDYGLPELNVADYDNEPDDLSRGNLYLIHPVASAVTGAEKDTAKKLDIFGMVVKFVGVDYDNELSSCNGYYSLYENGKWIAYDGVLRFIQNKTAHDLFIDPMPHKTGLAVVTGISEDLQTVFLETPTALELAQIKNLMSSESEDGTVNTSVH